MCDAPQALLPYLLMEKPCKKKHAISKAYCVTSDSFKRYVCIIKYTQINIRNIHCMLPDACRKHANSIYGK